MLPSVENHILWYAILSKSYIHSSLYMQYTLLIPIERSLSSVFSVLLERTAATQSQSYQDIPPISSAIRQVNELIVVDMVTPPITFEEELKKNPELKESDIQMLREWCSKQPHLPKMTDSELALFLHSNYYRLEPTKPTIDTYYTVRTHVPEFFAGTDPMGAKELRHAFNMAVYMPLANPTNDGYKVIYGKLIDLEPSHYVYNDCMKYFNMVLDLWLHTEGTSKGHIILIDLEGIQFGHAGRLSPMGLKKFLYYLQDGLPVRLKGLHFMNTVPVMDIILGMMKPFMKKELMEMLHIHSSTESLTRFIPLDILPNENGGKAGPLKELHENNIKWLENNRAYFQNDEAVMRVNEAVRPGKSKNATDLFGVEGSFKKLEID